MTITVSRRPFRTATQVESWRLKLVRDVFHCKLLADSLLKVNTTVATKLSPDEARWQVTIDQATIAGDYKVCFSDDLGASWHQIAAEGALLLRVLSLAEDSMHPSGLFSGGHQRVSARSGGLGFPIPASIEVAGHQLSSPFGGALLVSSTPCSSPTYEAVFDTVSLDSTSEKAIFTGSLGVQAGTYDLCYCDDQKDTSLDAVNYPTASTYIRSSFMSAGGGLVLAVSGLAQDVKDDLCLAKCSDGCIGPDCFCDGFDPTDPTLLHTDEALCLNEYKCRAACEALTTCTGYSTHRLVNQCVLFQGALTLDRSDNYHFQERKAGKACSDLPGDFTAVTETEKFEKYIGVVAVTERLNLDAQYVVSPGEETSIEIVGSGLDFAKDRIMVIECNDQCGLADASESVHFARNRPVSSFVDMPSLNVPPVETVTASSTWTFDKTYDEKYCPGNNLALASSAHELLREHQCYKKCYETAPCEGPECFCDGPTGGFMHGYDDADSTALCLNQTKCEDLCTILDDCHSIDMHKTRDRCFLNGVGCAAMIREDDPAAKAGPLTPDKNYKLVEKTLPDNFVHCKTLSDGTTPAGCRRLQQLGRSLSVEDVRGLLSRPDYGLSWNQVLRFANVTFEAAGTYRVCACDSTLSPCQTKSDYSVEVGKVHASGLQCLLGDAKFVKGQCVAQHWGGLRCYEDAAPAVASPFYDIGIPGHGDIDIFGADPKTKQALTAFCLYGPEERLDFSFCKKLV